MTVVIQGFPDRRSSEDNTAFRNRPEGVIGEGVLIGAWDNVPSETRLKKWLGARLFRFVRALSNGEAARANPAWIPVTDSH